jgi:two-component system sensor histidine kinase BaeS
MRIQNKLFLTLLITSLGVVTVMFALIRWSVDQGMLQYVNTREAERLKPVIADIAALYQEKGNSWQTIKNNPRLIHRLLRNHMSSLANNNPPPPHTRDNKPRREHPKPRPKRTPYHPPPNKLAILDQQQNPIFGRFNSDRPHQLLAIEANGETIGWLTRPQQQRFTEGFEFTFIQQQNKALIIISLLVLAISILFSLPLARHLILPLRDIGRSVHKLTQGDYSENKNLAAVKKRRDELGELAVYIQELTHTLNENDRSRKRWLADTSHELRTPVSILLGELEAMIDGVREIKKDNIQSLFIEIKQLQQLIDDLQALNNADIGGLSYRKSTINIVPLVEQQCHLNENLLKQHQLSLHTTLAATDINCYVDESRIAQLIDNLLSNCIKYCGQGDKVHITVTQSEQSAIICIEDSGPGVPKQALNQLFDHLYRVENSRNRNTGGSGLGLAICKRIIEGHNGEISAKQSPLGGLRIELTLPLATV